MPVLATLSFKTPTSSRKLPGTEIVFALEDNDRPWWYLVADPQRRFVPSSPERILADLLLVTAATYWDESLAASLPKLDLLIQQEFPVDFDQSDRDLSPLDSYVGAGLGVALELKFTEFAPLAVREIIHQTGLSIEGLQVHAI